MEGFCHRFSLDCTTPPPSSTRCDALRYTAALKQAKVKKYADVCRGAQSPTFQLGSYVRVKKPGITKKGHFRFTQPLQVMAQKGPATYKLSPASTLVPAACSQSAAQPDNVYMPPPAAMPPRAPPVPKQARRQIHPRAWFEDYVH